MKMPNRALMAIFRYEDYKKYVLDKVKEYPAGGHGVFKRISDALRIPPSTLTLVFRGDRDLTPEQGIELADYFGLTPSETEYFMLLIERSRAGNPRLRKYLEAKLSKARSEVESVGNRIPKQKELGPAEKAEYYSEWYYSAIRLLCSLPGTHTAPSISKQMNLPLSRVQSVLQFLMSCGLVEEKDGSYRRRQGDTFLHSHDPLVFRHHQNWRSRSLQRHQEQPELTDQEFCFTMPFTTSPAALRRIKQLLSDATVKAMEEVDTGKEECLGWINIDLMELSPKLRQ